MIRFKYILTPIAIVIYLYAGAGINGNIMQRELLIFGIRIAVWTIAGQ